MDKRIKDEYKTIQRVAVIDSLPIEMQDYALVDWETVSVVIGLKDIEHAREAVTNAGVPLVEISARRKLPRWGRLREFIVSRETSAVNR